MGWDGNGRVIRNNGAGSGADTWGQAEEDDRDIRSDDHDTHDQDLAEAIENCVTRDGQNAPSQDLPMNDKRHTNVADATADDQYAGWGQTKTHVAGAIDAALDPSVGALTDQASIAWDLEANPFGSATLAGNRTLANPTNAEDGGIYIFEAVQDATGGRTLDYGTDYEFGEEGEPMLSSGANRRDFLTFVYRNSKMNLVALAKGF